MSKVQIWLLLLHCLEDEMSKKRILGSILIFWSTSKAQVVYYFLLAKVVNSPSIYLILYVFDVEDLLHDSYHKAEKLFPNGIYSLRLTSRAQICS